MFFHIAYCMLLVMAMYICFYDYLNVYILVSYGCSLFISPSKFTRLMHLSPTFKNKSYRGSMPPDPPIGFEARPHCSQIDLQFFLNSNPSPYVSFWVVDLN